MGDLFRTPVTKSQEGGVLGRQWVLFTEQLEGVRRRLHGTLSRPFRWADLQTSAG